MGEFDFARWALPSVVVLAGAVWVVLASQDWRWTIAALALMYTAAFVLVAGTWRLELAVVKLVAGWMATAILGATQDPSQVELDRDRPSGVVFRLLAGGMVNLVIFSVVPEMASLLEPYLETINILQLAGGMLLAGMGLVMLGLNARPLRVVLALLILFAGFEVLYSMVERSTLVAGLLALVNLALALVGAYLHLVGKLDMRGSS